MTLAGEMPEDLEAPSFPPLLNGLEAARGQAAFDKAVAAAGLGADPGLLVWARRADAMEAALVLAPEEPMERAMGAVFALSLGLADAIGALAPPEVAVHFDWPAGLRVNGAACGGLRAAASAADPASVPEWLVIGAEVSYLPRPVPDPDATALIEEGCGEVTPLRLLESWSRHSLVWINTLLDEGMGPLHTAWSGKAWGMGEPLPDGSGTFMGLDELGGMLVRDGSRTLLRPLTEMLA